MTYLGQLAALPACAGEVESAALRKLTPGPGSWCIENDLWYLDGVCSFPSSFKSLHTVCWAAQLRTAHFEMISERGPWNARIKASELSQVLFDSDRHRERHDWHEWYMSSFAIQLDKALTSAQALGISPQGIYDQSIKKHVRAGCHRAAAAVNARKDLQKQLYDALLYHPLHKPHFEQRIRHKLAVWKLSIPQGRLSRRFAQNYARLAKLVQPRVQAACFRTAWNGWCVDYRFRNMEGRWWTKPCIFKCSEGAEDRIEHYCMCPHVVGFARRYLGIEVSACNLDNFLLVHSCMSDAALTLFAILVYAVYRTTNQARRTNTQSEQHIYDMLEENAKAATRHHAKSSAVLLSARHLLSAEWHPITGSAV